MMYYTIYKVTNNINGKIYIGSHKTKDVNDDYMGSGKYLMRSQIKHGIENFEKEILHVFDTPELMYAKEAELVNEEFIAEANTYNLKVGGFGGFDYINSRGLNTSPDRREGKIARLKNASKVRAKLDKDLVWKKRHVIACSNGLKEYYKTHIGHFTGKQHTEETKQKVGGKNSKHQSGKGNSQYGTMWITNDIENSKISKTDPVPDGWRKGRTQKTK